MREIKFRAWDNENMLHDWLIFTEEKGETTVRQLARKAVKVMQFTGLKDKNGKEIYEGDILKCERSYWNEKTKNLIVEWDEIDAGFFLLNKKDPVDSETFDRTSSFIVREHEREIIGNIYENPELIK